MNKYKKSINTKFYKTFLYREDCIIIRKLPLFILLISFSLLTGFNSANQIVISNIETTIIKAENTLRYDIKLKNTGTTQIKSEFDYPGHQPYGLEVVIRPNEELATKMEMDNSSKYKKMISMGGGSEGFINPGKEGSFHIEYKIKEGTDIKDIEKLAFDSTLIILDGVNIVKEFPLEKPNEN
ncbi:hypothetical protein [Peribacillus frigoritolerans]|uniref:hypothetical protein n=1 Tax=Peribacillus frigoritolerans TaxID=450367 RepID=UPI00227F2070|nr:hypothetical protein [Peribacillus frigoritolerans]MCY9139419.1 hypothetical protein [Peribacillus frigoritolerans]